MDQIKGQKLHGNSIILERKYHKDFVTVFKNIVNEQDTNLHGALHPAMTFEMQAKLEKLTKELQGFSTVQERYFTQLERMDQTFNQI